MRCSGEKLKNTLGTIECEDFDRLKLVFCSHARSLHDTVLEYLERDVEDVPATEKKKVTKKRAKKTTPEKKIEQKEKEEKEEKEEEKEEEDKSPRPRINSLETTSIFLQQLHLDESTERKEIQRQRDLKAKKKSLRRRTTKKMSGRQKWNPPKNTISLAQLFRVKKLIDPENTQCESFPTSEESNGNLIRMLYRQYQSDQEKCQESVKRELNETILRDMPKQILDEYKMSCEDYDTKKITEATNEESNDKVEKVENKKEEEEEIELIENDNTKWHARTFPYPRPANFELGIQEFLKTGKRTISKIPGGYLSGSEKSHRTRGFKLWNRYQKLKLSRERREKLYSEQKRKEEEAIRKEKERIKAISKRKSQVHMLSLHGPSLRMVRKFGSIVANMKSENLNVAGKTAKSIISRLE
eukprot:g6947.t1